MRYLRSSIFLVIVFVERRMTGVCVWGGGGQGKDEGTYNRKIADMKDWFWIELRFRVSGQ